MAPELVQRDKYDDRVDIWALGILTYIFLTGSQPFADSTIQKIHHNTVYQPIEFDDKIWKGISSVAQDFISQCLEKNW